MILDEEHVALALAILRDSERGYQVERRAHIAEIEEDEAHARIYLEAIGQVAEREAKVSINPEYMAARRRYADARAEVKRWERDWKSSETVCSVWQTEQKNAQASMRVK